MKISQQLFSLALHPLVLLLLLTDLSSFIPSDWRLTRLLASCLQYLLALAWFYHLSDIILCLRASPVSFRMPPINIWQGKSAEEKPEEKPMVVLGQEVVGIPKRVENEGPRWMNALIEQVWVNLLSSIEDLVESFWPVIRKKLRETPIGIDLILRNTFFLGRDPPRIDEIKVQNKNEDDNKLIIDVELSWTGNVAVDILIGASFNPFGKIPASLHSIHTTIKARVVLQDLCGEIPPLKSIEVSLLEVPEIHWDLGGVAEVGEIPIIEETIKNLINKELGRFVLPNKFVIPVESLDTTELSIPRPRGFVKVKVEEYRRLKNPDSWFQRLIGGRSTIVNVILGCESFQTKLSTEDKEDRTCSPKIPLENLEGLVLNCEIPVENPTGRVLHLKVCLYCNNKS